MNRPWRPETIQIGDWRITALLDGTMRLDGGAMWGVVPRVLWARMTPPAEDNTIQLSLRPFLLERGDLRVVLEPGIGGHLDEKWRRIYAIDRTTTLESSLRAAGLAPEDVTHVIASHCHFDHCGGWLTQRGGELVPLFPRAEHRAPRIEIAAAKEPGPVRADGYDARNVRVIERAGLLHAYEGDAELPRPRATEAAITDASSVITVNEGRPRRDRDLLPTSCRRLTTSSRPTSWPSTSTCRAPSPSRSEWFSSAPPRSAGSASSSRPEHLSVACAARATPRPRSPSPRGEGASAAPPNFATGMSRLTANLRQSCRIRLSSLRGLAVR
jgi:hypothetical protein